MLNNPLSILSKERFHPVLQGLSDSEVVFLDFSQIPADVEDYKNIKKFFETCRSQGLDPTTPEMRQEFNNKFLEATGKRYLIGRYGENRKEMLHGSQIEKEGRTIHLGIDIFSTKQESVFSPCDGVVVRTGKEEGSKTYGHYIIVEHTTNGLKWYSFFGHLSAELLPVGIIVKKGDKIAKLGSFEENGGWSIHLHYQLLTELPQSETPIGYSSLDNFELNSKLYPDPRIVLGSLY